MYGFLTLCVNVERYGLQLVLLQNQHCSKITIKVSNNRLNFICLVGNTVKILKYFYGLKLLFSVVIYCNIKFISVMRSCIFSIITPVFRVT